MSTTTYLLKEQVQAVLESIEQIELGGNLAVCPHCGDIIDLCECAGDYSEDFPDICPTCGESLDGYIPEPYGVWEWLEGVLSWDYIIGSDGTYRGADILIAWGGPTVVLDTRHNTIRGVWWTDRYEIGGVCCTQIDEALEEHFRCTVAV